MHDEMNGSSENAHSVILDQLPVSIPSGAADQFTVADISLPAYTRLAPEGGFEREARRNLGNWIRRCEAELGLED